MIHSARILPDNTNLIVQNMKRLLVNGLKNMQCDYPVDYRELISSYSSLIIHVGPDVFRNSRI